MRRLHRLSVLYVFLAFSCFQRAQSTVVLINQALKGRVFGSPNSNDVAKRIAVAGDGSIFIAGVTTPSKPDVMPWGDAEAGEKTGNSDIFIAKFSTSGQLVWVKRTGSDGEDLLNDFVLTSGGIYLCGSTSGKFAINPRGVSDAFVMKFTLDGIKAWRRPFQFGSTQYDSCNSLYVDSSSNKVYLTGTTMGKVFGNVMPANATTHYFVASFSELVDDDEVGLKIIQGQQRGSHGNCSGDGIAVANNRVYVMTSEWEGINKRDRAITYLSELDRESLVLRRLNIIQSSHEGSFQGRKMTVVNETGDVFFVGTTHLSGNKKEYHAVKFGLKEDGLSSGVLWATRVGHVYPEAHMVTQTPSIVTDVSQNMTYVAGVEDGYFTNSESGIVVVPLFKLRVSSGEVAQRWHRTTTVPLEKEEVTDIALDPSNAIVYTGTWDGGPDLRTNVLIGSFGSRGHSSRTPGSYPVSSGSFIQAGQIDEDAERKMGRGKIIGFILLGLGAAGIALTAMVAYGMRSSRRNVKLDGEEVSSTSCEIEEIRRRVVESHRKAGFAQTDDEIVIGGSGKPR